MISVYDVIKRPVESERAHLLSEEGKYVFACDVRATKADIRRAVEELFEVKVERVNTAIMPGKRKRFGRSFGKRSNWKKAVVQLSAGQTLQLFADEGDFFDEEDGE